MKVIKSIPFRLFLFSVPVWLIFSFLDLLDEQGSGVDMISVGIIGIPVFYIICYVLFHILLKTFDKPAIWTVCLIVANIVLPFIICYLVGENKWFVHQATGGWENFLNGIEYYLLGFSNFAAVLLTIPFYFIYRHYLKKKGDI